MIHAVRCDKATFREVEFKKGFNVVLADRTKESTRKDSCNGLGKTTLLEIIHFCLGSSARKGQNVLVDKLNDWTFTLEITLGDIPFSISRSTSGPSRIHIDGDTGNWPVPPDSGGWLGVKNWNQLLSHLVFGLPYPPSEESTYNPTFRSLISYIIRRGPDAFSTPFEHFRKQREWDKQVNNCYLLRLNWEYAAEWQRFKDKEKLLGQLKKAAKTGLMKGALGNIGELETEKVNLEDLVQQEQAALFSFKVHPQYHRLTEQADQLTQQIHKLLDENVADRRFLKMYEESLSDEEPPCQVDVAKLYEQAGTVLPELVCKRLQDVEQFHTTLISNRRHFLDTEIQRLNVEIQDRDRAITTFTEERASLLSVLETHGALEEYTRLQELHQKTVARIDELSNRISSLRRFEMGKSSLRIEKEQLHQRTLTDHDERAMFWKQAVTQFNRCSQALYEAPGELVINPGPAGFRFNVEIQRSGSAGINKMKVFCYDLTLASLWTRQQGGPGFLIHDSTIFEGVDSRQVAHALEMAAAESEQANYQYICTLNSDGLPDADFSEGFDINSHICLRLTDEKPEGSLLGIRI